MIRIPFYGGNGGQYILVFTDLVYEVQVIGLQTFRQIVLYMLTLRALLLFFVLFGL
jgi:hypothetical protein